MPLTAGVHRELLSLGNPSRTSSSSCWRNGSSSRRYHTWVSCWVSRAAMTKVNVITSMAIAPAGQTSDLIQFRLHHSCGLRQNFVNS